MKKKPVHQSLHNKDKDLVNFDKIPTSIPSEDKEKFYELVRKNVEAVVEGMKYCSTKKLVSRRDFVGKGLIAGGAFALTPKLTKSGLSLFPQAKAQVPGKGNPRIFVISANDGYQVQSDVVFGNNMPGDLADQDYRNMGFIDADLPSTNTNITSMGLRWTGRSNVNGLLAGIRTGAGNAYAALQNSVIANVVHAAFPDDGAGQRRLGITTSLAAVFGPGLSTFAAGGVQGTESGTAFREAFLNPAASPVFVPNAAAAVNMPGAAAPGIKWQNAFGANNSVTSNSIVYATLERLVNMGIASKGSVESVKKDLLLQNSAKVKMLNTTLPAWKSSSLQAADVATLQGIFNANTFANQGLRDTMMQLSHLATNSVDGLPVATVVAFEQDGGDYHQGGGAIAAHQTYVTALGRKIGAALAAAVARNTALTVTVISNGAQGGGARDANNGALTCTGDDPNFCATLSFHFNPDASKRSALKLAGKYNVGGIVSTTQGRGAIKAGIGNEFATNNNLALAVIVANITRFWGKDANWAAAEAIGLPSLASMENFIAFS